MIEAASWREGFVQGLMDVPGECPEGLEAEAYKRGVTAGVAHRDKLREEHDVRRTTDELASR